MTTPRIVCLLPVRNGGPALLEWLEAVPAFCDAVVALDDGSTDETGATLRSHPIVKSVLTNPRRDTWFGWNDGANRVRLLAEAANFAPDWILSIDADERIDPTDAAALRAFVDHAALAGVGYGFQLFSAAGAGMVHPDPAVVHRLFAHRPGQRFAASTLFCTPVPIGMPLVTTTVRIRHLAETDARITKLREADPQGAFRHRYPEPRPTEAAVRWTPRRAGLPVLGAGPLVAGDNPPATPGLADPDLEKTVLVCLLAVRDGQTDLPGWFDNVRRFADAVVALDDGSTDTTADLLAGERLVKVRLANPPRHSGYRGWNDGVNRARLLAAAGDLQPDWVLYLDADERIAPDDIAALRAFVDDEADPGYAYGFPVHRMIEDADHYDRVEMMAFRLFAYHRDLRLPTDRLHFVPVPDDIPPRRWRATTIRLQHLAALTEDRRRARWQKYLESDPGNEWEADYTYALVPPGQIRPWPARPAGLPVLAGAPGARVAEWEAADLDLEGPELSIVVVLDPDDDADALALLAQVAAARPAVAHEVLMVDAARDGTGDLARSRHPFVNLIPLDARFAGDRARNLGVRAARGDHVLVLRPGDTVGPGALDAVVAAHAAGHGLVSGDVVNASPSETGWTAYFVDEGAAGDAVAPGRASWPRQPLLELDMLGSPDLDVTAELFGLGFTTARVPSLELVHRATDQDRAELLWSRFRRGRSLDRHIGGAAARGRRRARSGLVDVAPRRSRIDEFVRAASPEEAAAYGRVRPWVTATLVATWLGSSYERLRRRAGGR